MRAERTFFPREEDVHPWIDQDSPPAHIHTKTKHQHKHHRQAVHNCNPLTTTHATLTHATRILIYSTYPLSIQAHPPRPDAVAIPEKSKERKESAHTLAGTPKQQCHNYPHAPYATLTHAKARAEQTFERSMRIGAGKGKPTNY